ncbi:MAG: hypothetical protein V3T81_08375 [Thermoanaerobaculia bacterium]
MSTSPNQDQLLDAEEIFGEIVSELNEPGPSLDPVAVTEASPAPRAEAPAATEPTESPQLDAPPTVLGAAADSETDDESVPTATTEVEPPEEAEAPEEVETTPEDVETEATPEPSARPVPVSVPQPRRTATAHPASDREIACWVESTLSLVQESAAQATGKAPSGDGVEAWLNRTLGVTPATTEAVGAKASRPRAPTGPPDTAEGREDGPEGTVTPEEPTAAEESAEAEGLVSAEEIRSHQRQAHLLEGRRAHRILLVAVIAGLLAGLLAAFLATRLVHGSWLPRSPEAVVREEPASTRMTAGAAGNAIPQAPATIPDFLETGTADRVPEAADDTTAIPESEPL